MNFIQNDTISPILRLMNMSEFFSQVVDYVLHLPFLEFLGLFFGLLCVLFLIKESIWNWPFGILYVLVSFVIFWQQRLYGDFILHIFFLVLNIYGWYYWVFGDNNKNDQHVPVTTLPFRYLFMTCLLSAMGVVVFGYFLQHLPQLIEGLPEASLPYWDATTSILSVTGMWLTARKKIESWYFWFLVDVLAAGIYFYKEIYFYSLLYFIYIGMAVSGYLVWKKIMQKQSSSL